jgi:hypothetical protein
LTGEPVNLFCLVRHFSSWACNRHFPGLPIREGGTASDRSMDELPCGSSA